MFVISFLVVVSYVFWNYHEDIKGQMDWETESPALTPSHILIYCEHCMASFSVIFVSSLRWWC